MLQEENFSKENATLKTSGKNYMLQVKGVIFLLYILLILHIFLPEIMYIGLAT